MSVESIEGYLEKAREYNQKLLANAGISEECRSIAKDTLKKILLIEKAHIVTAAKNLLAPSNMIEFCIEHDIKTSVPKQEKHKRLLHSDLLGTMPWFRNGIAVVSHGLREEKELLPSPRTVECCMDDFKYHDTPINSKILNDTIPKTVTEKLKEKREEVVKRRLNFHKMYETLANEINDKLKVDDAHKADGTNDDIVKILVETAFEVQPQLNL